MLDRQPPPTPFDSVQTSMVQGFGELARFFGFNGVLGEIYGVLLLHAEPLCLEELAQQVHKPKSSISQYTRTMEHMRMIRHVCRVASDQENRRKYYEAETNFEVLAHDMAQRKLNELERLQRIIGFNLTQLDRLSDTGQLRGNEIGIVIERVHSLSSFLTVTTGFITAFIEALSVNDASRADAREAPRR